MITGVGKKKNKVQPLKIMLFFTLMFAVFVFFFFFYCYSDETIWDFLRENLS